MAELDSLKIQITASARDAQKAIDKLTTSLIGLGNAMNMSVLNTFSSRMQRLADVSKTLNGKAITNVTKALTELSNANLSGLGDVVAALESLPKSVPDYSNLSLLAKAMKELGGTAGSRAGSSMMEIANGLSALDNVNIEPFGEEAAVLTKQLRALGSKSIATAATSLSEVARGLIEVKDAGNFNSSGLTQLTQSLAAFGRKSAQSAITTIPQIATAFRGLIDTLSTAPNISQKVIDLANAMANLAGNMNGVPTSVTRTNKSLTLFQGHAHKAQKSAFSLAATIGKLYASFWMFMRVGRWFGESMKLASDLVEVQNVVDNVFTDMSDKMEEFAKTSVDTLGMSELTAKQIASRFQAMGVNMGVPKAAIESTNDFLQATTKMRDGSGKAYADVAHSMADISLNLTRLAGDMASFYNQDYADVAKALESTFTGMTKPLRQYGLDITEASMKSWALRNGMDANIKTMTQYEKMLLRYQYIMANTTAAHGDFIRTQDTWANTIKISKERLIQLKKVLGTIGVNTFKPLVKAFNNAMNTIIHLAESTLNALGKIFGWHVEIADVGTLADDTEDMADNLDDAAGSAKKMKDYMLGIDELNVFNPDEGSGGSGGGVSGGGAGDSDALVKWEEREKEYDSIYDTLYKLGKRIAEVEKEWLQGIDWSDIYAKAEAFGKGLASFLNGYLSDAELFWEKGRFIANTINTIAHALKAFNEEFDGYQLGVDIGSWINGFTDNLDWITIKRAAELFAEDLAQTINGAVNTADWSRVGKTLAEALNTAVTFLHTFITTTNWGNVGNALGEVINGFVRNFDARKAAETIAGALRGAFAFVNNLLKTTDFYALGKKIGEFLATLNIFEYVDDIAELLWNVLKGACLALAGMIKEAPFETALIAGFGLFKLLGLGNVISTKLGNAILVALGGAPIKNAVATGASGVGTSFGSQFAKTAASLGTSKLATFMTTDLGTLASNTGILGKAGLIGAGIGSAVFAGYMGFEVGKKIGKALFPEAAEYYDMSASQIVDYIIGNFERIPEGIKEMTSSGFDETKRFFDNIGTVSQSYVIAELYKLGELEGENDEYIRNLTDLYNNTDVTWSQIKNDILGGKIEIDASGFDAIRTAMEETGASASEVNAAIMYLKNAQQEYYDGFGAWLEKETSYKNAIDQGAISKDYAYQIYLRDKKAKEDEAAVTETLTDKQADLTASTDTLSGSLDAQTEELSKLAEQYANNEITWDEYIKKTGEVNSKMDSLTESTNRATSSFNGMPSGIANVVSSMNESTEATLSAEEETEKFQGLWKDYTISNVDISQLHEINTVLETINDSSTNLVTAFEENFGKISSSLKAKLDESKEVITTFDTELNEKLTKLFEDTLPKDFDSATDSLDTFLRTSSESIASFDEDLGEKINTLFDDSLPTKFETLSGDFETLLTTNEETLTGSLGNIENAIGGTIDNIQKKFETFLSWFDKNILEKTKSSFWTNALSGIPGVFDTTFRGVSNTIATIMNALIEQINSAMNIRWDALMVNGKQVVAAGQAKLFEIQPIPMFERGGFPEDGLFYANHNELVGGFNGRTAVANNEQIVGGIREGVQEAMSDVVFNMLNPYLTDIAQSSRETANKDFTVNIGDRDIAMANNRGQSLVGMSIIS